MKKIENSRQLRAEIERLRTVVKQQEKIIKEDVEAIREDLKPANILWDALSSLTGMKAKRNEFLKDGIAYGISMILQRFILKTERKMEGKVYGFIDTLFDRVKSMLNKVINFSAKRSERQEEKEDFIREEE